MKDFNGGYIVASQEAYELLQQIGYEDSNTWTTGIKYILVEDDLLYFNYEERPINFKQFYINKGELSWDIPCAFNDITYDTSTIEDLDNLPTIGEEDATIISNSTDNIHNRDVDSNINNTISIKDDNGKEYVFEKPEFECKLLGIERDLVFGWVKDDGGYLFASSWILNNGFENDNKSAQYDLAPIKPKWYEDKELLSKGVPVIKNDGSGLIYIVNNYTKYEDSEWVSHEKMGAEAYALNLDSYRVCTKEELNSLYCEGK